MSTIHWGRFFAVVGSAFAAGFLGGFSNSMREAQDRLGATATAQDLIHAINAAGVGGLLGGIVLAAPAAGAFFVKPQKPEEM